MAGDILLYETEQVPVGDDQRQHLELARVVAERFNNRYGSTFVVPVGVNPPVGSRVMDLQDPSRKMSKSVSSPLGSISLFDDRAAIEKKVKRAVTDTDGEVRFDWEHKPGLANLLEIFSALSGDSPEVIAGKYSRYGDLKSDLAALLGETLPPIAQRYRELRADPGALDEILVRGREKAAAIAAPIYERAARAVGLF